MAECIMVLAAVPALYGIGLFYGRLGGWAWLLVRQPRTAGSPAAGVSDLPHDRYQTALATAGAVIRHFAERPDAAQHERLASVTYAILEAMDRGEELRQANAACPE